MIESDGMSCEAAKKQVQEAAERLFAHRTDEQSKALQNAKVLGSPENIIKPDSELFDDAFNGS